MAKNSQDMLNETMLGGLVPTDTEIYHKAGVIRCEVLAPGESNRPTKVSIMETEAPPTMLFPTIPIDKVGT